MSNNKNQSKSAFANLFINTAEEDSSSKKVAKEFLSVEGVNTDKVVADGLKRIKQMQMLTKAKQTEREMEAAANAKQKAVDWVDQLLSNIDFSLPELVQKEELSMSFRNLESLNKEDIRNILIKHFMLKFMKEQKNTPE